VAIPDQRRNRCFCETVPAAVVRRVFGVCYEWVSNQGTHFKNQVMAELQHVLGAHHHFTTARCPWANSIVMHHLLCLFRSCRSEWRMATNQWVETRLVIMLVLNQLTSPSIGNVSPVTAMSGRPAMALTDLIALPGSLKAAILEEVAVAQKGTIKEAREALDAMHKEMSAANAKKRDAAHRSHDKKKSVKSAQFVVGDYVIYQDVWQHQHTKLRTTWCGRTFVPCMPAGSSSMPRGTARDDRAVGPRGSQLRRFRS
jgi:hypothetical protein